MFRRILPGILTAAALLLDIAILPVFTQSPYMPVFSLLTALVMGLLLGRTSGLWHGLAAGLLMDILVGTPLGLQTFLYVGVGYLGGVFGRAFTRHPLTPLIALCCEALPTRDTERPVLTAGLTPLWNSSFSRYICPSVMEMTFVGM